jgi:hypothetical protein
MLRSGDQMLKDQGIRWSIGQVATSKQAISTNKKQISGGGQEKKRKDKTQSERSKAK